MSTNRVEREMKAAGVVLITNPRIREEMNANDMLRALPYRPTCKLKASPAPAYTEENGWTIKQFTDEKGDWYQRERDGEFERWYAVLKRARPGQKSYRRKRPSEPIDSNDRLDRLDDLEWFRSVLFGLVADSEERRMFGRVGESIAKSLMRRIGKDLSLIQHVIQEPELEHDSPNRSAPKIAADKVNVRRQETTESMSSQL